MDSSPPSYGRYPSSQNYAPSAPSLPHDYPSSHDSIKGQQMSSSHNNPHPTPPSSILHHQHQPQPQPPGYPHSSSSSSYPYYSPPPPPVVPNYSTSQFPPGTPPDIIRSFQMADKDHSGFIDARELQEALSFGYHKFSLRTVQLLLFLFRNPGDSLKIGPNEFSALWRCLGEWRAIFERFDRDRSGKIDTVELTDALRSLGYAVPPTVLQFLISKYEDGSGRKGELSFDSFVECGMIIKGLTEKFKEKDTRYTGSATLSYDTFMSMVIPFIVP